MRMRKLNLNRQFLSLGKCDMLFHWLCTCLPGYPLDYKGKYLEMQQLPVLLVLCRAIPLECGF